MRNRKIAVLASVVVAVTLAAAGPVDAAPETAQGPAEAPAVLCGPDNWFDIDYVAQFEPPPDPSKDGIYRRKVPTRGGCASSWAHGDGQLSTAAIAAQCRTGIEPRFGPYPITLRFAETYVLENRADCIEVMIGISRGLLDPGPAPLFPGGQ